MTKHIIAPFNPTEAQWGGLARSIVWWMRSYPSNKHTPSTLVEHLSNLGHEIPTWMGDEAEMRTKDHVISKGTIAALIYKAMLAELPEPGRYETKAGETLTGIALRQLGNADRWEEIARVNSVAFPDLGPNEYMPHGSLLNMPPYEILTGLKQVPVTYAANTGDQMPVSDFPDAYLVVSKETPSMKSVVLGRPIAANRELFDVFELSVHRVPHWTDPHILWDGSEWVGYDEAGLELTRNVERDKVRDELVIYNHNQLGHPV